jgi:hypothetical protein
VTNEDFVGNRDAFANKCVTGDFAPAADARALLDFDERTYAGFIPDFAAVKVYKVMDDDTAAEFYIRRDDAKLSGHCRGGDR